MKLVLAGLLGLGCLFSCEGDLPAPDAPGPSPTISATAEPTPSPTEPPRPSVAPTARVTQRPETGRTVKGIASTYGPGYAGYLALPEGPGHRVRVCGESACITRVSNDAGPSLAMQRAGRIVDLNVADFEKVCGCAWGRGLIPVTVTYLNGG